MKTATQNLENDHVYILQLTDVMEAMAGQKSDNATHIENVIGLIKGFADGFHHAKEENLLFPLLVKKGYSTQHGPIAVMLDDHDMGRSYVRGMAEGLDDLKSRRDGALEKVYANMKGYVDLLRNHIAKENNVLFRMADNVLSEQEQQDLLGEFAKIEKDSKYGFIVTESIRSIEKLSKAYNCPIKEHDSMSYS